MEKGSELKWKPKIQDLNQVLKFPEVKKPVIQTKIKDDEESVDVLDMLDSLEGKKPVKEKWEEYTKEPEDLEDQIDEITGQFVVEKLMDVYVLLI